MPSPGPGATEKDQSFRIGTYGSTLDYHGIPASNIAHGRSNHLAVHGPDGPYFARSPRSGSSTGFGTQRVVHVVYLVKSLVYIGLGALVVSPFSWSDPIVFERPSSGRLLWEVLGLGCGSGPLTLRFLPPLGGFLYWLRPGTVRLAPWPRVPLTAGDPRDPSTSRSTSPSSLAAVWSASPGTRASAAPARLVPLVVALAVLGLRDKTIFLAARGEHYWVTLLLFARRRGPGRGLSSSWSRSGGVRRHRNSTGTSRSSSPS